MLRRVAENPDRWDALLDILPSDLDCELDPHAGLGLSAAEAAARRERRPGEGQAVEAGPDLAWIALSPRGQVLALSASATDALGELGTADAGAPIVWATSENATSADSALRAARARGVQQVLRLERDEGPLFALATPYRAAPFLAELDVGPDTACLLLPTSDPTAQLWRVVRDSFELTDAEVRVARRLREGLSLQQTADRLGVSLNTVRNQLRGVFDKMGVQRQSDLVRVLTELATLSPAVGLTSGSGDEPPLQKLTLPDGRRLSYRDYGDPAGVAVLHLHEGLGSCLLPPGSQARALALGVRVVSIDRPGYGESDPRPDYRFATVGADLAAACDVLGLTDVAISCVGSASPAGLHVAHRLGPRARLLLLCSGRPPRRARLGRNPLGELRSRMEALPWVSDAMFAIIRARRSAPLIRTMLRRVASFSPGDAAFMDASPWMVDYICTCAGEALGRANRGPVHELKAFRRAEEAAPPPVGCPVVVWHGAEDAMAPLDDLLTYLEGLAPEVRHFEGIGHFLALKHGGEMMERLAKA